MEHCRRLIIILLAVAVTIPVVVKSRPSPDVKVSAAFSVASSSHGYIRISGDVRHPGMYPLGVNNLTVDVITMAIPVQSIYLLEPVGSETVPVKNGESLQILVDSNGRALVTRGSIPAVERLVMGLPLDINVMSEADLDKVPGIGPALARRIVRYRQNNGDDMTVQDLLLVEGVGEKKFYSLRKFF
jgi:competence protein ComEA